MLVFDSLMAMSYKKQDNQSIKRLVDNIKQGEIKL